MALRVMFLERKYITSNNAYKNMHHSFNIMAFRCVYNDCKMHASYFYSLVQ